MLKDSIYKRYAVKAETSKKPEEGAYWFVFYEDKLLLRENSSKLSLLYAVSLEELNLAPIRSICIGTFEEKPCYMAEVTSVLGLSEEIGTYELTALYYEAEHDLYLLAGKAFQVMNWDKTHQFCGRCGQKMHVMDKEMAKECPNCKLISYTNISPAVIMGIFKEDKILLAHSAGFRGNMYSILAGYVEAGETLEEGVKREVMEEVGISIKNIKYFGSQAWPFSHSLMIGFTADYESGEISIDNKEITDADWFDINNLPELPSEYSIAREIINEYIKANTITI